MVLVNTQPDVEFKYFIDIPSSQCTFCSGREQGTGRLRLYLVSHERGRIYVRRGLAGVWDELSPAHRVRIERAIAAAFRDPRIPRYSSTVKV